MQESTNIKENTQTLRMTAQKSGSEESLFCGGYRRYRSGNGAQGAQGTDGYCTVRRSMSRLATFGPTIT